MMSEQGKNNNQTVLIALVVIAALLAAIVGVLVWQSNKNKDTASSTSTTSSTTSNTSTTGTTDNTPFDAATATKVPAGTDPKTHVENYLKACAKGDFATAYKLLPLATQKNYGTADAYASQLKGYGDLSNYSVSEAKTEGANTIVTGTQNIQGMAFAYDWTFVKGSDGNWLVKSRAQAGQ